MAQGCLFLAPRYPRLGEVHYGKSGDRPLDMPDSTDAAQTRTGLALEVFGYWSRRLQFHWDQLVDPRYFGRIGSRQELEGQLRSSRATLPSHRPPYRPSAIARRRFLQLKKSGRLDLFP